MGTSLIYKIVGEDLFYSQKYLISNLKDSGEIKPIDYAVDKLLRLKNSKEYKYMEIGELVKYLALYFHEFKNISFEPSIEHMSILSKINKSFYSLSTNIDICSRERLCFDNIIDSKSSKEGIMNFLIYIAINIVREKIIVGQLELGHKSFSILEIEGLSINAYLRGKR